MYKILIVDDEPVVSKALRFIIEKNFNGIIKIETARTGREAIQKAEILVPEIVFMDIKMPGISGLDAIKEIKSKYKNTVFIILTAYGQFNFTKEAISMGVIEYLLKPIASEKVVAAVNRAIDIIQTAKESRLKELQIKERLESAIPILESGFICSLLFFEDNTNELRNYEQIFDIEKKSGYIMTIELGETFVQSNMVNKIGIGVKSQLHYPALRDIIKFKYNCIVGPLLLNRIVVFILVDIQEDEYVQRLETIGAAKDIIEQLIEILNIDFRIGIGNCFNNLESLSYSYEQSLKAIRFAQSKEVMHFMDIPTEKVVKIEYIMQENEFLNNARQGNFAACVEIFNYMYEELMQENKSLVKIQVEIIKLFFALQRIVWEREEDGGSLFQLVSFEDMLEITDKVELKKWCRQKIESLVKRIYTVKKETVSKFTLKAKDYINQNYSKDITLEDVARDVNISPNYFSKIFKEEIGKTFIDYLTFIRMNAAKELLKKDEITIKEICYLIGYSDPNYFSRIFKKVVGISPTEYRENNLHL